MLKHADVWRAIDLLAERNGLSVSALARCAGLDSTAFNLSKRIKDRRKRWPSTESIAAILKATETTLDDFVAMAQSGDAVRQTIPILDNKEAAKDGHFDEAGYPKGRGWDNMPVPCISDPNAFAIEICDDEAEPVYCDGDRVIVSPSEKPRKGDRIVLRTASGNLLIGRLGRETSLKIEFVFFNPARLALNLPRKEVVWIGRILWASQ
ncbi:MAG: helix-turn-helix transcriptional regulator [Alphaproteobacteria bacterium]|nr:helix-turn-helix transcriptional regulator [Alphaproteobacteria bacterium]